ncbi:hypothetical protein LEP48_11495 [Isoptericola sp. NEAU-Y5]|uniref:Uncharacterized protein n=1 Tax=Isoptericola luteus TaxID=2879484 RepID=A0ABS7ZGC5_9MICO|nr:hypothetical protein [Isoptericola sp. NEAU-Y5]MCA5893968.1 hypothetical protein [Isoptericola sp. NEAU-Y5]
MTHGPRIVDARLHLLSRQVLDVDGEPVSTVDDLELRGPDGSEARAGQEAHVAAILVGPALVTRLFGGRAPTSRMPRIAWDDVGHLGTAVELAVSSDGLDADWVEHWVRERLVERIPGGRHDPEGDR